MAKILSPEVPGERLGRDPFLHLYGIFLEQRALGDSVQAPLTRHVEGGALVQLEHTLLLFSMAYGNCHSQYENNTLNSHFQNLLKKQTINNILLKN
mmetsp:Transcript_19487/g.54791  ORF Transcript_19487/g.54791 Transcript_19487/m.54791 type:complete len:96 (-) Transcript_19487:8-295(-)